MCLILFAFQFHPDFPLIVAANRDEYYDRPTRTAHFWEDYPELFAGRDLKAKGTWMGITKTGRFAAVTNFRESLSSVCPQAGEPLHSRGELATHFLTHAINHQDYLTELMHCKNRYAGYNLLIGNHQQLLYYSNRLCNFQSLTPGIYGLSNGLLNDPWPKVNSGKIALKETLKQTTDPAQLLTILLDTTQANVDATLPDTGIGIDRERLLSSRFIRTENYGTRASTVLMVSNQNEVIVWEKNSTPNTTDEKIEKIRFIIR